jgi:hypothetical protein
MSWGSGTGAVKFDEPPPVTRRRRAQRGTSVTETPAQGQSATRRRVTQRAAAHVASVRSGAHVTGRLPSIAGQRARVHEAAAEWEQWRAVRYGRIAWGYFHLALIKIPLDVIQWVTETPPRCVLAAFLGFLAVKYH